MQLSEKSRDRSDGESAELTTIQTGVQQRVTEGREEPGNVEIILAEKPELLSQAVL